MHQKIKCSLILIFISNLMIIKSSSQDGYQKVYIKLESSEGRKLPTELLQNIWLGATKSNDNTYIQNEGPFEDFDSIFLKLVPGKYEVGVYVKAYEDVYFDLTVGNLDTAINTTIRKHLPVPKTDIGLKTQSVFDSELSVSTITSEDIIASGALTVEELFRLLPGMIVRQKTNGNFDIHMRGNDYVPPFNNLVSSINSFTLVMIDKRIIYSYTLGGTFWESLPISILEIDRIEILRGPSSPLYGSNAVTGAINIVTKNPNYNDRFSKKFKFDMRLQGGLNTNIDPAQNLDELLNGESYSADILLSLKLTDSSSFRVSHYRKEFNRFQEKYFSYLLNDYVVGDSLRFVTSGRPYSEVVDDGNNLDPINKSRKVNLGYNGSYFLNLSNLNLRVSAGYQNSEVQTAFFENIATGLTYRNSKTFYSDIYFEFKESLKFQASYLTGERDLYPKTDRLRYKLNVLNGYLSFDFIDRIKSLKKIGLNLFDVRLEGQLTTFDDTEYFESNEGRGFLNAKESLSSLAPSLRIDWSRDIKNKTEIKDTIKFVGAIRYERYLDPSDVYLTGQAILSYNIGNFSNLRLGYSRANSGQTFATIFTELDDVTDTSTQFFRFLGNQSLSLPVSNSFEVGVRNKISRNNNITAGLEFFRTTTKDFILQTPKEPFPEVRGSIEATVIPIQYDNTNIKSIQTGFTAEFDYSPTNNFKFRLFGTFQNTILENQDNPVGSVISTHNWTPSTYGGVYFRYKFKRVNIFSNLYYLSKQTFTHRTGEDINIIELSPITNCSISASYELNKPQSQIKWVFNLGIRNLEILGNTNQIEFPVADRINSLYLIGIDVSR